MSSKRLRINIEDSDGARYDIKLDGNINRQKVLRLFEIMDLVDIEEGPKAPKLDSINAKIWHIVDKYYPMGKFTSSTILEKYEDEYNEPIKLSVISTYLSRFSIRGKVQRNKTGREWTYQAPRIHH